MEGEKEREGGKEGEEREEEKRGGAGIGERGEGSKEGGGRGWGREEGIDRESAQASALGAEREGAGCRQVWDGGERLWVFITFYFQKLVYYKLFLNALSTFYFFLKVKFSCGLYTTKMEKGREKSENVGRVAVSPQAWAYLLFFTLELPAL